MIAGCRYNVYIMNSRLKNKVNEQYGKLMDTKCKGINWCFVKSNLRISEPLWMFFSPTVNSNRAWRVTYGWKALSLGTKA